MIPFEVPKIYCNCKVNKSPRVDCSKFKVSAVVHKATDFVDCTLELYKDCGIILLVLF